MSGNERTRLHVHVYGGLTSCNDGHCHLRPGVSSPPIFRGNTHYHRVYGNTSYNDGHYHHYDAVSGPAISLPNGEHTHHVSLTTSFNDGHDHHIVDYVEATPSDRPHYR